MSNLFSTFKKYTSEKLMKDAVSVSYYGKLNYHKLLNIKLLLFIMSNFCK